MAAAPPERDPAASQHCPARDDILQLSIAPQGSAPIFAFLTIQLPWPGLDVLCSNPKQQGVTTMAMERSINQQGCVNSTESSSFQNYVLTFTPLHNYCRSANPAPTLTKPCVA